MNQILVRPAVLLIDEFRSGTLGKITVEWCKDYE